MLINITLKEELQVITVFVLVSETLVCVWLTSINIFALTNSMSCQVKDTNELASS